MVQPLMGLVTGKGKVSELTPDSTGAGGGNPQPPPLVRRAAGGPGGGGDPDDQGESGRKPNESKKGRVDERLAPQPEADAEDGDD